MKIEILDMFFFLEKILIKQKINVLKLKGLGAAFMRATK